MDEWKKEKNQPNTKTASSIHYWLKTSGVSFAFLIQISVCSHIAPIGVSLFPRSLSDFSSHFSRKEMCGLNETHEVLVEILIPVLECRPTTEYKLVELPAQQEIAIDILLGW